MAGDERQRAGRRRLGGDHPESLGKDRGHDRHLAEWDQVHEVPVLERAGEEGSRGRDSLELGAIVPEADDDGTGAGFT